MKIAALIVRILLGLGFVIFGANILHAFLPQPPIPEGSPVGQFMAIMVPTHWMDVVGLFQLIGGLCVLSGRATPLGLFLLAPILVNILAFHACVMGGEGIMPGLVFSVFEAFLLYVYRDYFRGIFSFNAVASVR